MKIRKTTPVKASADIIIEQPLSNACADTTSCPDETTVICECKYQAAIDLISAAIESLAEIAKDDCIAKDSIANLGVVMLDLKGGC